MGAKHMKQFLLFFAVSIVIGIVQTSFGVFIEHFIPNPRHAMIVFGWVSLLIGFIGMAVFYRIGEE